MLQKVVAIKDRAVDAFLRPFYAPALGQAIRSFSDEINRADKDNTMYMHPEDYDLYHLADFDDATGQFTNNKTPTQICIGKQVTTKG